MSVTPFRAAKAVGRGIVKMLRNLYGMDTPEQKERERRYRIRSEAGRKSWVTRRANATKGFLDEVERIADRKESTSAFEGGKL